MPSYMIRNVDRDALHAFRGACHLVGIQPAIVLHDFLVRACPILDTLSDEARVTVDLRYPRLGPMTPASHGT